LFGTVRGGLVKRKWKIVGVLFAVICIFVFVALVYSLASFFGELSFFEEERVVIVPVRGMITLTGCPASFGAPSCANVGEIKRLLRTVDEEDSIKAVVLDIESGGGFVVASRELMRAVEDTEKPVVAWIGESGASGAYYAASASDLIVADRDSVTGSIGVIMQLQHYYGLFDWLMINHTTIKSGEYKDTGSPLRPMSDEERQMLQEVIDDIQADFLTDVTANRNLSEEAVREVGEGRIYLGSRAHELGLVDELGGLEYAVDRAAELADIEGEPGVERVEPERRLLDILSQLSAHAGYGFGQAFAGTKNPESNLYRSFA